MEKGNKVWLFRDIHLCTIYSTKKKCREAYLGKLHYYKGKRIRIEDDHWRYVVWNEVDEPSGDECSMHYANITATDEYGHQKEISIGYGCKIVQ